MKTLTTNASLEKNKKDAVPINILKIEFDGSIGEKYYADRVLSIPVVTEKELVASWGNYNFAISEDIGSSKSSSIAIIDESGIILGYIRAQDVYKKKATIYQWFEGNSFSDMIVLFSGTIKDISRKEDPPIIEVVLESMEQNQDERIGTPATESAFSSISTEQDGQVIPLVIGKVDRFSGSIQVVSSKRTSLVMPCKWNSKEAIVDDSREFTQNTYMDLWIGSELCRGKFEGCKLTLSQRAKVIAHGKTASMSPNGITFVANLSPNGTSWIGSTVRVYDAGQVYNYTITSFTSPNIYACDGVFSPMLQANAYFEIKSPYTNHDIGTEVYEKKDSYIWAINDAASISVEKIEMRGSIFVAGKKEVETWVKLHEDYAVLNLNNSDYSGTLSHNISTVTMPFDPKNLPNSPYSDNNLYVTMTGANYTNPVDIIVYLAQKLGKVYPGDFDTTSETAVKAQVDYLKFGFVITQKLTWEVINDIAFQARISVVPDANGKLKFKYLQNASSTSVKTISNDVRLIDSLETIIPEQVYNRLYVSFFENGKQKKLEISDNVSIAKYGIREKTINLWCHQKRYTAEAIALFWLRRWASALERCKFSVFLDNIELERNDWITLNFPGFQSNQIAEITEISHAPGDRENIDRIEILCRLPKFAGCASSCEQFEQTGCASSCEQVCMSTAMTGCDYSCETSAQDACNIGCVSACMLSCTNYVQNFNPQPCISQCQVGCVTDTLTNPDCQVGCQVGCTSGEQGCDTSCMIGCTVGIDSSGGGGGEEYPDGECVTSCMSSCTSGCTSITTACQSGLEGACSTACQNGCTTGGCTTACQSGCTTGTQACNQCCQFACTTLCQSSCQQGSCRSGCTASVTERSFTMCTSSIETSCKASCEGKCQQCCMYDGTETVYKCSTQCQTGCIQNCETQAQVFPMPGDVCYLSCQGWCMSDGLQTGCNLYCTFGCRCACTASCQGSSCMSSSETACMCLCQTGAQSACLSTNETCWTSAQGACVINNMSTGCSVACQGFCMTNMMTGCALYCTLGCRCSCTGRCTATSCTTSCESACRCQCQTNAETVNEACGAGYCQVSTTTINTCWDSCMFTCTTQCRSFCMTTTQNACSTRCQGWCMNNAMTGCNIFCTVGCRCDCMATCESNCRSGGCEQNCQCTCQTSVQ